MLSVFFLVNALKPRTKHRKKRSHTFRYGFSFNVLLFAYCSHMICVWARVRGRESSATYNVVSQPAPSCISILARRNQATYRMIHPVLWHRRIHLHTHTPIHALHSTQTISIHDRLIARKNKTKQNTMVNQFGQLHIENNNNCDSGASAPKDKIIPY